MWPEPKPWISTLGGNLGLDLNVLAGQDLSGVEPNPGQTEIKVSWGPTPVWTWKPPDFTSLQQELKLHDVTTVLTYVVYLN